MVRPIRWVLTALGAGLLVGGGASIFGTPAAEVLYAASGPTGTCTERAGCVGLYSLEVGNTGRELQPEVRVRLHAAVVDAAILPPTVRDQGKVDRPFRVTREAEAVTLALGPVKPEERVVVSFVLRGERLEALPPWDRTLVAVEPARGAAFPGNPGGVVLLRIWYMIARAF
jgi:hypothetical protein